MAATAFAFACLVADLITLAFALAEALCLRSSSELIKGVSECTVAEAGVGRDKRRAGVTPLDAASAADSTVEGNATAQYISDLLNPLNIKCSRIAHGIPMGGELEYLDSATLMHALQARNQVKIDKEYDHT